MDLKILEIASDTKNHKVVKNHTHQSKIRTPYVVMKWKLV